MDNSLAGYELLFDALAFVVGAVVGSFLNVCIYRLPLDLSVNKPRWSFCPSCKKQIPFHQNIPLVSWLFLRGPLRELREPHRLSLFRGRAPDRSALSLRLEIFPVADGDRLLGFRLDPDRRDFHRLRALHHSG